ncbi:MAG: HupE/UreJ family protein [Variovorax sp.]|nr:MAG: HupE/UreJ family protein [Variovorax sp.]
MKRMAAWLLRLVFIAVAVLATPAHAHKASDAYLQLQRVEGGVQLRWDIALRDLDAVLELDRDGDQKLSWGEVKERLPDVRAYALSHLALQRGQCALAEARPPALERRVDGTYLVLQLESRCAVGKSLDVDYGLFREVDPTHRGLLRVDMGANEAPVLRSLDPVAGVQAVALRAGPDAAADAAPAERSLASGAAFFLDGVHHILIGYDHILFLISLLLPAVLLRTASGWTPVARWQDAVWPMVAIVTMFTLGHSITLALASLGIVSLSPKVIEPAIALTIIVAAVDNIVPLLRGHRRLFTFLFGLIHGFGFASVLAELDLPVGSFVAALLQFNLGVEAGQLVIVSIALSVLLVLRRWRGYQAVLLRGGSAFAIVVAALWFAERVFDLKILPV